MGLNAQRLIAETYMKNKIDNNKPVESSRSLSGHLRCNQAVIGAILVLFLTSFSNNATLKGTWEFAGDITNGKKAGAPTEYILQRKYKASNFEAFVLQKGEKTLKYEAGNYTLRNDSCFETQTYCMQPSALKGITVNYSYTIRNDTLISNGILPGGIVVEEHWKRLK